MQEAHSVSYSSLIFHTEAFESRSVSISAAYAHSTSAAKLVTTAGDSPA